MGKRKGAKTRTPGVDGRERIIRAAVEIFRAVGPIGVRLNDIAKAAQVDAPLIHYHFKSIDDLQYEVILRILGELRSVAVEAFVADPSVAKRMAGYVGAYFRWLKAKRDLLKVWVYFYALAVDEPRYRALNSQIRKEGRERIKLMVYEGLENGEFRPAVPMKADELAVHIQGIITGNGIMAATEEGLLPVEEFERQTVRAVMLLLGVEK